jgi:hypothetical protein
MDQDLLNTRLKTIKYVKTLIWAKIFKKNTPTRLKTIKYVKTLIWAKIFKKNTPKHMQQKQKLVNEISSNKLLHNKENKQNEYTTYGMGKN